jgi:hypothetical protein
MISCYFCIALHALYKQVLYKTGGKQIKKNEINKAIIRSKKNGFLNLIEYLFFKKNVIFVKNL